MVNDEPIKARFAFTLPDDYVRFWNAGLLTNDVLTGLKVSRHSWLSPDMIAERPWPEYKIQELVPCAQTPGRDHYCWYRETDGAWIAECPRDSDFGEGVAPHFEGFVFRSLLEEFTDSWLTEDINAIAIIFRRYTARVSGVLRPTWSEILRKCSLKRPTLNRWDRPHVISEEETSAIINAELAFPMLRKSFRQHLT